jgi:hypothetical protein
MRKIWIEIQKGENTIFSRQYAFDGIDEDFGIVKQIIKIILGELKGVGKSLLIIIRNGLFAIIRMLISSKDMKDRSDIVWTKDDIKVITKVIDNTRWEKE